ncbi:MAG: hypothetical protein WBN75_19085 [Verrucomicrobiia bacterium]
MINRWLWALACAISGLLLLSCGLRVPAYLRAVDDNVIQRAGRDTPALITQGLSLANQQNLGTAWLFLQAAQAEGIPGRGRLGLAVTNAMRQHPDWLVWGNDSALKRLFGNDSPSPEPFTSFIVRQKNREAALGRLRASASPTVQELLRCRELTGTTLFPPSPSASGQAFDAAVTICGLLVEEGRLTTDLGDDIFKLASAANRGGNSQPLEQVLMDFMSLGRRFNWDQLVAFTGRLEDGGTMHALAGQVRDAGGQLPVLFSAVALSGQPAAVAKYVARFNKTALNDLSFSLRFGAGAVNELLARDQLLYRSGPRRHLGVDWSWRMPWLAFALKWLAYLSSGFLLAASLHFARPAVSSLERPLQVRGFHVVRESLFALGFLLVVLLLSEPFLAQDTRKEEFIFRLHVPTTGHVVLAGFARNHPNIMNNMILLTLLLFFVLQALIYIACLVKLAEIRRQNVTPRFKLRLLENEDHLFDAGLYLGFVGTIISLILVSMGVIKFSLMAAYSSTSFGIIFVCVFKIFNLRPARRRLLLEAEAEAAGTAAPMPVTTS